MEGKEKCEILKEIRRKIAKVNGIPLEIPACSWQGECPGTCPRCETELTYLTSQIHHKAESGFSVKVDGLCEDYVNGKYPGNDSLYLGKNADLPEVSDIQYPFLRINRLRMGQDGHGVTSLVGGACCSLHCTWCVNRKYLQEKPEWISPEELLRRLIRDDLYFRSTGGGITFGGGEPLLHAEFLRQFRRICPSSWHLTAQTSLAVPEENVKTAIQVIDCFIVDCKSMNRHTYAQYTGGDMTLMKNNLSLLLEQAGSGRIVVRVPMIPTYNTKWEVRRSIRKLRRMGVLMVDPFRYRVDLHG